MGDWVFGIVYVFVLGVFGFCFLRFWFVLRFVDCGLLGSVFSRC